MKRTTYTGKLSIGRSHGPEGDRISIELEDEASGCRFVEIECSPEVFGRAVTGASALPCAFDVYPECPLGKRRELKEELVVVPGGPYNTEAQRAEAAVKPFEVDGWKARRSDLTNHHRTVDRVTGHGHVQKVVFTRYVD